MKIEWLNDDCTEAYVTKGWFRKRRAHVYRDKDSYRWTFVTSKRRVEQTFQGWISDRREKAMTTDREWQPVRALPPARLVERKTGGAE